MAGKGQQSEKPTQQRVQRARREGQFPSARDFVGAMQFAAFVAVLGAWGAYWLNLNRVSTRVLLQRAFRHGDLSPAGLRDLFIWVVSQSVLPLAIAGAILLIVTFAAQTVATRFGFSLKKLAPDLKRLSPLAKLKGLPRQNFPAFVQALLLMPVVAAAVYFIVKARINEYFRLPWQPIEKGIVVVAGSVQELLWKAAAVFVVFGLVNLFRQHQQYTRDLGMSRQDIRDEHKESEGDPQIKQRVRRMQRDYRRRNMLKNVPTATAVIVNPTHYAVAIKYQMNSMAAPTVVAKGKNYLAKRIRQRAIENQVPIIENPPLAQALYKFADIGQEIPSNLYRAVAEILAYIFKLMNGRMPGQDA